MYVWDTIINLEKRRGWFAVLGLFAMRFCLRRGGNLATIETPTWLERGIFPTEISSSFSRWVTRLCSTRIMWRGSFADVLFLSPPHHMNPDSLGGIIGVKNG